MGSGAHHPGGFAMLHQSTNRPHRRHRPRLLLVVLTLLVAGIMPPATADSGPEGALPVLAGTTTIRFDGFTGVRIRVPRAVTLDRDTVEQSIDYGDVGYAMVQLSPLDAPCKVSFLPPDDEWCQDYQFRYGEGQQLGSSTHTQPRDMMLEAGRIDVYGITAGTVEITLRVPELDGEVIIDATGSLDGELRRHDAECATQATPVGCRYQGHGGHRFDVVPASSKVGAYTWARRPNDGPTGDGSPGTQSTSSCIYPFNNPSSPQSTDPDDYPLGCDFVNDPFSRFFLSASISPLAVETAAIRADFQPQDGPKYTGFAAHSVEGYELVDEPGQYHSFGFWFNRTIDCPSGNWTAC
jgi:hypothetical protein